MKNAPKGFITALQKLGHSDTLLAGSILGELCVYHSIDDQSIPVFHQFEFPVLEITLLGDSVFILHPNNVSVCENVLFQQPTFKIIIDIADLVGKYKDIGIFQRLKINEISNVLLLGSSKGHLFMYSLPDLTLIDYLNLEDSVKIQAMDIYQNYLVIATNKNNQIFDISCKKFIKLTVQESGFKYPITTDLKIFENNLNNLPHNLIYAQSGIEGKVSVINTQMESQTDPTVTINTAAKSAPISLTCTDSNPSGIAIVNQPEKFVFRAHRTTLADNNVLIGPIYSLNIIKDYLITTGYGGSSNNNHANARNGIDGCICLWDVEKKRRIKQCKGFPLSVVKTAVVKSASPFEEIVVCGCSSDIYKNMPVPSASENGRIEPAESSLVVMILHSSSGGQSV